MQCEKEKKNKKKKEKIILNNPIIRIRIGFNYILFNIDDSNELFRTKNQSLIFFILNFLLTYDKKKKKTEKDFGTFKLF